MENSGNTQKDLFKNQYRTSPIRYCHHDYNAGAYFITICTKNRQNYFGNIALNKNEEFEMQLSEIGIYLNKVIQGISNHNFYAEIPLFVIMPNHIHLIVIINDSIETEHALSTTKPLNNTETGHAPSLQMLNISRKKGKLSITIGNIKSAITKYANTHHLSFGWQTRFYDHIIRNQSEMNQYATYIEQNIANWGIDELNAELS